MADTMMASGGRTTAISGTGNRASTRSTRKKKTQMLSPKKFIDWVMTKAVPKDKGFEAGCAELYRDCYLDTPTFNNFFKDANKEKNVSKSVWLYDSTRVIVPDVDYYHASWVDGVKPLTYILAQAPATPEAAKDFFKLLAHVKAEGLIIAEAGDEFSKHISTTFTPLASEGKKKSSEKIDDVLTCTINEQGVKNLKTVRFHRWAESISAVELVDMMEKTRKFLGCPLKGPLVIVCKDGAAKSGLVCFLDIESDRIAKHGRVRATETVKMIRLMRFNAFDTFESFDLGINGVLELCNRKKK